MEVLDYIDLPITEPKHVSQAVQKFIDERKDIISTLDVTIRVSICKTQKTVRAAKGERLEMLAQLVKLTGIDTWEEGPYRFDFSKGDYRYGKHAVHITASEAVVLYQKLVRGQGDDAWPPFYANIKNRLGKEFLKGCV